MMREPSKREGGFEASDFPALQDFLGAYFHEDFVDEYGSAEAAAKQFCDDASHEEIAQTGVELQRLLGHLQGRPLAEWQAVLQRLGGAWQLQSEKDLKAIAELLATHGK